MTGGDDLESDDEYLDQNWHRNEQVEVDLDDSESTRKRSRDDGEDDGDDDDQEASKKKKIKSPRHLLIEAGRGIADANAKVQSAFLWTAYSHALALTGNDDNNDDDDSDDDAEQSKDDEKFQPHQFAQPKKQAQSTKYDKSMVTYLKSGVLQSMKRLKKWKHEKSPCVIIVCASALRAVAILKELSSLNIRAAKLFSKHMSLSDQVNMLDQNSYSIAVGTPNRLLKLFETKEDDDDDEGALSLEHTELVVIDCNEDRKKFTVCTLNDTAPDLFQFVRSAVAPQMKKRKTIKFGMF